MRLSRQPNLFYANDMNNAVFHADSKYAFTLCQTHLIKIEHFYTKLRFIKIYSYGLKKMTLI